MVFYSNIELAEYLGCSPSAITRWLAKGLPHDFDGFRYVYKLDSVLDWLVTQSPRLQRWVNSIANRPADGR